MSCGDTLQLKLLIYFMWHLSTAVVGNLVMLNLDSVLLEFYAFYKGSADGRQFDSLFCLISDAVWLHGILLLFGECFLIMYKLAV